MKYLNVMLELNIGIFPGGVKFLTVILEYDWETVLLKEYNT